MASMLTYKPLPAFHVIARRVSMALLEFSRMLKILGDKNEKDCHLLEPSLVELRYISGALARFFYFNRSNILAVVPQPLIIHPT
jgi:hypothetical protein